MKNAVRWWHILLLVLITLVGGWLRNAPRTTRPAWFDEADTWRSTIGDSTAPMPIEQFLIWRAHFETPPLAFLLARTAVELVDPPVTTGPHAAEWRPAVSTLRLPALICGILLIPAVFLLGTLAIDPLVGLAAALLVTFDPNMVDQAQQCRMYAVLVLLTVVAMILAVHLFRAPKCRPWGWTALGLTLGLALCTLQFAVIIWAGLGFAAVCLLVLSYRKKDAAATSWPIFSGLTMAYVIAGALAYIGVYRTIARVLTDQGDSPNMTRSAIAREIVVYAKDMIHLGMPGLLVWVLVVLGMMVLLTRCKVAGLVVLGVAVANLAIIFPFRKLHHFMDVRYLSLIGPALWMGLAALALGWRSCVIRIIGTAVVCCFVVLQAWQCLHIERFWTPPDRYVLPVQIAALKPTLTPDDAVVFNPQALDVLGHYLHVYEDGVLEKGIYDFIRLRPDPQVPAEFNKPRTCLIIGMMNYAGRLPDAEKVIHTLARHYEVQIDPAEMAKHLRLNHVVIVRFSKGAASFASFAPGQEKITVE